MLSFKTLKRFTLGFFSSLLFISFSWASDWAFTTTLQGTMGDYGDSRFRNNIHSAGAQIAAAYKERASLTVGGEWSHVDFVNSFTNNIFGGNWHGSGKVSFWPDQLPGKLTARLDYHFIDNNDTSDFSDEVKVWNPIISFLNNDKTFYLDVGYAHSSYKEDLKLHQYTPTVGFLLWDDWYQVRAYMINPSNKSRVQGTELTKAVEVKWTHWLQPGHWLKPFNVQASFMGGNRIHPVDPDALAVYSLGDLQTKNAYAIAAEWKLPHDMSLMLLGARSHWRQRTLNDNYVNETLFVSVSKKW